MTYYPCPLPSGVRSHEGEFECEFGGYRLSGVWAVDWKDSGDERAFMAALEGIYLGDVEIAYLNRTRFHEFLSTEFRVRAWESEYGVDDLEIG